MRKSFSKKILSVALALAMVGSSSAIALTANAASVPTESAAASVSTETTSANLASNIQDGTILHCFDWTFADIEKEIPNIAASGFTTVQTSPVQVKNDGKTWYWAYLPRYFTIGDTEIGNRDTLKSLCDTAETYGVKIIVDVVANHLEGDHTNIDPELKDSQYWHNSGLSTDLKNIDWEKRWDVTHGDIGMADLATENSLVQSKVINYLKDLESVGVDGFRFDAAKHIGLPSEGDTFWSNITKATNCFAYGETIDNPGGDAVSVIKEYQNYITVTDSGYCWDVRDAFNKGQAPTTTGNFAARGASASKFVYWGETHDEYSNDSDYGTQNTSQNIIDRAYAVVAARSGSSALYFSRPSSNTKESIKLGQKGSTHFTSSEVAEVNKFHNAAVGKQEYYAASNGCAVITRQGVGAVIVKGSGSGNVSVENGGGYCPAGEYVDAVSGAKFTVTSSNISGSIGSSGIAVLYEAEPNGPTPSITPGSTSFKTDTLSLTLNYKDATSGSYSLDGTNYTNFSNGQTITIGSGVAYESTIDVYVKATDGTTTCDPVHYTYKKSNKVQTVSFDNTSYNWSSVYAYIYSGTTLNNGAWPGVAMTKGSDNTYTLEVPENLANGSVIFTESETATTNRYPADMEPGLDLGGKSMILKANHSWVENQDVTTPTQATIATQATAIAQNSVLLGDANLDGSVSISDATEVQMHLASMKTLTGDYETAADVDENKIINVKDATYIQNYLLGKTDQSANVGKYTGGTTPTTPTQATVATTPTTATQATTPTTATGNYIYYKNTNNWSTPYAYYWSTDDTKMTTWPGVAMTKVSGDVYSVEVPATVTNVIFSNNGSGQTGDLTVPSMGQIYDNGSWSPYGGTTPTTPTQGTTPTTPSGDGTIYFVAGDWTTASARMAVYAFNDESDNAWFSMTDMGNGTFSANIGTKYKNVIFCRMNPATTDNSWSNKWNQTSDLAIPSGQNCFTVSAGQWDNATGTWSVYGG